MEILSTQRLSLIPCNIMMLQAAIEGDKQLSEIFSFVIQVVLDAFNDFPFDNGSKRIGYFLFGFHVIIDLT